MADKSSKRLPPQMEKAVASFVKDIVEKDFPPNAAGRAKSQREIAKELGISQSVLSNAVTYDPAKGENQKALGIAANGLIALRKYSGQTIDSILGLELPSRAVEAREMIEQLLDHTEQIGSVVNSLVQKPSPNSKLGKALREVEKIKMRIEHEKRQEERIRRINDMPSVPPRRKAAG